MQEDNSAPLQRALCLVPCALCRVPCAFRTLRFDSATLAPFLTHSTAQLCDIITDGQEFSVLISSVAMLQSEDESSTTFRNVGI